MWNFVIHRIPPRGIVLKPFGKPSENGVLPFYALVVGQDVMVLALNHDESRRAVEQTKGIVHLNALANRDVVVCHAMDKQQRRVYFVAPRRGK